MSRIRIAVGEMPSDLQVGAGEWKELCQRVAATKADLFVLNELPFGPWVSCHETFDGEIFMRSVEAHDRGIEALGELGIPNILGSRLIMTEQGKRVNSGFVWREGQGFEDFYQKRHVPCSPGYYERVWYEQGDAKFPLIEVVGLKVGMLICTDIMFNEHARHYGRQGAELIVVPRAMPPVARDFFDSALTMAAMVSGAYVASSNRAGVDELGAPFEGRGVVHNPLGQHMAQTSFLDPITCCDLDIELVNTKKQWYPCDVPE